MGRSGYWSWYGWVELTADSGYGPWSDRSDQEVAGKTRTGAEGSGMERADPDVHDWGQAGRRRSSWAAGRAHGAGRALGRAWAELHPSPWSREMEPLERNLSKGPLCRDL